MLQATLKVSGSELTAELLEKIRGLFKGDSKDLEVTISVKQKETPEAARLRIDRAIESIEKSEKLATFSPPQYEDLVHNLSRQRNLSIFPRKPMSNLWDRRRMTLTSF